MYRLMLQNGLDEAKKHAEKTLLDATEAHHAVLQEKEEHASRLQARCLQLQEEINRKVAALEASENDTHAAIESMEASANESNELRARVAQVSRAQCERRKRKKFRDL